MAKKRKEQVRAEEVRKRMLAETVNRLLGKEPKVPVVFKNDPFKIELAGFELQEK